MKHVAFLTSFLLSGILAAQSGKSIHQLNYVIDISNPSEGVADVHLVYSGPERDSTVFVLPSNWGESSKLRFFRMISASQVNSYRISIDSTRLTCYHAGRATFRLHYEILNGVKDSISGDEEIYLLQLKSDYFSAFSNGLLCAVEDSICTLTTANIRFKLPKKWKQVYSNLGEGKELRIDAAPNSQLKNGIFHAGDYRVYKSLTTTNQKLTFCIRGNWSFGDKELMTEVAATLDQQRRFWDDFTAPAFFVSLNAMISPVTGA